MLVAALLHTVVLFRNDSKIEVASAAWAVVVAACDLVAAVGGDTCTGEEMPTYSRPDEPEACVMLEPER